MMIAVFNLCGIDGVGFWVWCLHLMGSECIDEWEAKPCLSR